MMDGITAFVPCRKGSERVPRKNVRPFGPFSLGLVELKLRQLLECSAIDRVVLSTNDDEILDYAEGIGAPQLVLHKRTEDLSDSITSTDELIRHASGLIGSGHVLWTHVTSPFVGTELYGRIIAAYRKALNDGYDSLMTTKPIHAFLWTDVAPLNYDRTREKWPRTQTLPVVHEVNSAVFIAPAAIYKQLGDRIGENVCLYPVDKLTAIDIDWEEDFVVAEQLLMKGLVKI